MRCVGAGYLSLRLLGGFRRRRAAPTPGLEIVPVDAFTDDTFAPFWTAASAAFDFIPVRSAEYVNWRFGDPRAGRFLLRAAHEWDRLVGYAAVRVGTPRAVVAELLTLPDRADIARALLDDASVVARAARSDSVEVRLPARHPHVAPAHHAGFVSLSGRSAEVSSKFHVTLRGADISELAGLGDPQMRMHLMASDSDLV